MNEFLTPAEVMALKKEILSSLHCALPGIVESFDGESSTACIRLALQGMPVLRDVPVFAGNGVNADRKSTRLNSSHTDSSRMPSSA